MAHEEYLRRNLVVAKAQGAKAGVSMALKRLEQQTRPPQWLVKALRGVLERQDCLPIELAAWRNAAPDAPAEVGNTVTRRSTQCSE